MNDLDPLLHEAIARVRGPVDARPSVTDVRRRARRHNRRRMAATAGVVACTGVATAALVIRRDSADTSTVASAPVDAADAAPASTVFVSSEFSTTTFLGLPAMTITAELVWSALVGASNDPAGVGFVTAPTDEVAARTMPIAEQFGCTSEECQGMFTYVVWHELAKTLGFIDLLELQAVNPNVDYTVPPVVGGVLQTPYSGQVSTATTNPNDETPVTVSLFDGVILIDGGAPTGAMEDAYQRLAGYNRTIVPGTGKTFEQTLLMPVGDNTAMATAVGGLFGLDGFDTWDPSLVATPMQAMVAVVIGADYFERVQSANASATTSTPDTTTTIVG